jgi:hypothetical protein
MVLFTVAIARDSLENTNHNKTTVTHFTEIPYFTDTRSSIGAG